MAARTAKIGSGTFRSSLCDDQAPVLTLSLSSRFSPSPREHAVLLKLVEGTLADRRISTFLLPAPAGDRSGTIELATAITDLGGEAVATVSCAGASREDLFSFIDTLRRTGVESFIFVTGDMPADVRPREMRDLFDVDSVGLFMLRDEWDRAGVTGTAPFAGCAVSPFKTFEAEVYWQYEKLKRKTAAGSGFIVTQPGFDLGRYGELLQFCRSVGIRQPAVAGLLVPDIETVRHLADGAVPGVAIPGELATDISSGTRKDRPRELRRAAAMMRSLRGLGYSGILLEGALDDTDALRMLLDSYESPRPTEKNVPPRSHFPLDGFHYFQRDREGSPAREPSPLVPVQKRHPLYVFGHLVDLFAFKKKSVISASLEALCRFCDRGPIRTRMLWFVEFLAKAPLYGCRMCGDCTLYACAFICNVDRCPKKLVNGPCGGGMGGWCEVYPGRKRCLWVDVHRRLKVLQERPAFPTPPIPPGERKLYGTCSWINFFLGRDHQRRGRDGKKG